MGNDGFNGYFTSFYKARILEIMWDLQYHYDHIIKIWRFVLIQSMHFFNYTGIQWLFILLFKEKNLISDSI